jgi:dihydroxy-acid dehydratase
MFTANSMNCLNEALGLALPATAPLSPPMSNTPESVRAGGRRIVEHVPTAFYERGRQTRCCRARSPRKAAFHNAMTLDIAMGGSTNTVLHLLADRP